MTSAAAHPPQPETEARPPANSTWRRSSVIAQAFRPPRGPLVRIVRVSGPRPPGQMPCSVVRSTSKCSSPVMRELRRGSSASRAAKARASSSSSTTCWSESLPRRPRWLIWASSRSCAGPCRPRSSTSVTSSAALPSVGIHCHPRASAIPPAARPAGSLRPAQTVCAPPAQPPRPARPAHAAIRPTGRWSRAHARRRPGHPPILGYQPNSIACRKAATLG